MGLEGFEAHRAPEKFADSLSWVQGSPLQYGLPVFPSDLRAQGTAVRIGKPHQRIMGEDLPQQVEIISGVVTRLEQVLSHVSILLRKNSDRCTSLQSGKAFRGMTSKSAGRINDIHAFDAIAQAADSGEDAVLLPPRFQEGDHRLADDPAPFPPDDASCAQPPEGVQHRGASPVLPQVEHDVAGEPYQGQKRNSLLHQPPLPLAGAQAGEGEHLPCVGLKGQGRGPCMVPL